MSIKQEARLKLKLQSIGAAGVVFFAIKGVLWLTVPLLLSNCFAGG